MKTWSFLFNPFYNATVNSYRAMNKIANYTASALDKRKADAFFNSLLVALLPSVTNYTNAYATWVSQLGLQISSSQSLASLLAELSATKIEDWETAIKGVYKSTTPQFTALFPFHRIPFQNGSQTDRMNAVLALSKAIGSDADLAKVKTEVDAFYALLAAAYNAQKGNITGTGTNSDAVEAARVAVATELYGTLALLMNHYKDNPTEVANFFDLQTIRNHEQTIFKHDINAGETLLAVTHTFDAGEEVRLVNRGATELHFILTKETTDVVGVTAVVVAANSQIVINATTLGDIVNNRYLKVLNVDANLKGAYTIELV